MKWTPTVWVWNDEELTMMKQWSDSFWDEVEQIKNQDDFSIFISFWINTYVEAVANAVIQAWKIPHQNWKGFFFVARKYIACKKVNW